MNNVRKVYHFITIIWLKYKALILSKLLYSSEKHLFSVNSFILVKVPWILVTASLYKNLINVNFLDKVCFI
jgi:hypothetical protein